MTKTRRDISLIITDADYGYFTAGNPSICMQTTRGSEAFCVVINPEKDIREIGHLYYVHYKNSNGYLEIDVASDSERNRWVKKSDKRALRKWCKKNEKLIVDAAIKHENDVNEAVEKEAKLENEQESLRLFSNMLPGVDREPPPCPNCGFRASSVKNLIFHLNDDERIQREEIANLLQDWHDNGLIDIAFKVEGSDNDKFIS